MNAYTAASQEERQNYILEPELFAILAFRNVYSRELNRR